MTRLITASDVEALRLRDDAGLDAHIEAVTAAYREMGQGTARLLGRQSLNTDVEPEAARPRSFKILGAALLEAGFMGVVTYPAGYGRPLDFRILLSSATGGELLAIVEGEAVTQWATAAVTATATRALSRPESAVLGLIGCGTFAFDQPRAIARVRQLEEVRCYSRDAAKRQAFAERLAAELKGISVRAVESPAAAAAGADILTTVTTAHSPVIASGEIAEGTHINAIGMHYPRTREIDSATVARASFFVDDIAQTFAEKGEFLIPLAEGAIGEGHLRGDLGSLLAGTAEGRREDAEVTLFGSGGTALEYIGVAACLYRAAEAAGVGRALERT
ncbi:MAG: ornithine cyclodeaminase family protein [Rhodovibrionaceae bacterium]